MSSGILNLTSAEVVALSTVNRETRTTNPRHCDPAEQKTRSQRLCKEKERFKLSCSKSSRDQPFDLRAPQVLG